MIYFECVWIVKQHLKKIYNLKTFFSAYPKSTNYLLDTPLKKNKKKSVR